MKGLELSERYFNEFGMPMLQNEFGEILPFLAAGLVGSGSECFGYDDETSADHDFEPGFCIFVPEGKVSEKDIFRLERAYARLPDEFEGFKRQKVAPAGGNRHGVIKIADFYIGKTGFGDGLPDLRTWLRLPEFYLAEATNGKVFFDNYGKFSEIRKNLAQMPRDIRLKRLAGNLASSSQSGEYNYLRCISHGEHGAAQLTLFEFEKAVSNAFFLLNGKYQPFYKWKYRAMRDLPDGDGICEKLVFLISHPNGYDDIDGKLAFIEDINEYLCEKSAEVFGIPRRKNTEQTAFSLNDIISSSEIRNMNIFCAV